MPGERASKGGKSIAVNFKLAQTVFDWTLKLIPLVVAIAGFAFQFYLNQDRSLDRAKRDDERIEKLETRLNELNRQLVQEQIDKSVLQQRLEDQEKFYVLTKTKH